MRTKVAINRLNIHLLASNSKISLRDHFSNTIQGKLKVIFISIHSFSLPQFSEFSLTFSLRNFAGRDKNDERTL
jgi:hypothetical protein